MKSRFILLAALLGSAVSLAQAEGQKPPAAGGEAPYKASEDGKKIDAATHKGFTTYRSSACVACHGLHATGGAGGGPDILAYLKKSSKEDFKTTVLKGRPGTQMAPWESNPVISANIDAIYAYLKGRSDGKIAQGSLEKLE